MNKQQIIAILEAELESTLSHQDVIIAQSVAERIIELLTEEDETT